MSRVFLGGNKNTDGSSHINTAHVTVSFGPPRLTEGNIENKAVKVGLIQDLGITQQRNVVKLFEYGNEEYVLVSDNKTRNHIQMNRILFDGPSLLKYIGYAYSSERASSMRNSTGRLTDGKEGMIDHNNQVVYQRLLTQLGFEKTIKNIPGTGDFWFNLSSELFENPIGVFLNIQQRLPNGYLADYGGVFLENCLINSHSLSLSSQIRVMSESVVMEFGRAIPLKKYDGKTIMYIEQMLTNSFKGGRL